ncbi:MAG: G8 domain-containing protein [Gammaproteobacteria bacterium]
MSTSSGGVGATPPASALTAIASCVVDSENDVVIGGPDAPAGCQNVEMDPSGNSSVPFGEIQIAAGGTLHIEGAAPGSSNQGASIARDSIPLVPLERPVQTICVEDGGKLEFGSAGKPITTRSKVVLRFVGNRNSGGSGKLCPGDPDFAKGIVVEAGGSLLMYGAKGVPQNGGVSWTTLAAPAGSNVPGAKVASRGTKTLALTANVTKGPEGWQPGDWIVVATTDYVPFHSEFVQIASVRAGGVNDAGSTVTLKQPLKYYHFGSLAPSSASATCPDPLYPAHSATSTQPAFLCDGADRNYGVDERAEVGLISRDIELKAVTEAVTKVPPPATSSVHWGGEIMIHAGFEKVAIQGVRLSKFGKDKLGSYPIHFHMIGDAKNTPLINADSVDHSYNKCVTIHSTSNLTISNLVCARIVGHIFYEELESSLQPPPPPPPAKPPTVATMNNPAGDSGIVFNHDLGIGAMSNSFDIYAAKDSKGNSYMRPQMIDQYWWAGDYMTNDQCAADNTCINYDGFNIPDTDNQLQATHGGCYTPGPTGSWVGGGICPYEATSNGMYYIEPASGFWIQNPGTVLTNDAIAGCQGDGVGYWWVPPNVPIMVAGNMIDLRLNPLGEVKDDRSSACYHAYFAEGENNVNSGQLSPIQNGENKLGLDAPNIITHFDGLTATHDRWRALWLRGTASWYAVKNGHFADDNRGATLLTSGGVDGNAPGIWQLLEDSVFVGMSQNNVGRWGPCPKLNTFGPNTGFEYGCIDYSHPQSGSAHSGEVVGKGYPGPDRNSYGYQIYDGPPLIFHDRFVNYNYNTDPDSATNCNSANASPDPTTCAFSYALDDADRQALHAWQLLNYTGYKHYEGDAAFGWFPANQNAYPTATTTKELTWVNTNFRHQIFTQHVKIDNTFGDGDKNTAIIDEDGTLAGFGVKLAPNSGTSPVYDVALNTLPFNSTSNSVDECLSRGAQDQAIQGRDSSLMAPAELGTLEFSSLYPWKPDRDPNGPQTWPGVTTSHWQKMTFTRTDKVPNGKGGTFRPAMSLNSRAGQGYWEPRVSNGYGYTVAVAPATAPFIPKDQNTGKAGIYKWIDIGVADVVDPNLSAAHPFYVRLGIDYASVDGNGTVRKPTGNFTIKRGYKSYYGGVFYNGSNFPDGKKNTIYNYFTLWQNCSGLDGHRTSPGGDQVPNIPIKGGPGCPAGGSNLPAVMTLSPATHYADLTNSDGTPNIGKYYYDAATGYLWLNVVQEEPNAKGPSPIGSCDSNFDGGTPDPACPQNHGESYYVCPKNGCIIYTIAMNDPNYTPGPSPSFTVLPPAATHLPPAPAEQNKLVQYGTDTVITRTEKLDKQGVPYHTANNVPACPVTEPPAGN